MKESQNCNPMSFKFSFKSAKELLQQLSWIYQYHFLDHNKCSITFVWLKFQHPYHNKCSITFVWLKFQHPFTWLKFWQPLATIMHTTKPQYIWQKINMTKRISANQLLFQQYYDQSEKNAVQFFLRCSLDHLESRWTNILQGGGRGVWSPRRRNITFWTNM